MALGSNSAAEKAVVTWEVGPTEDVVQSLMETLVDPKLPLRVSASNSPSQDEQKSVAKQMHAVVLLYNYYHRRQKPELSFLGFVSFCTLAVTVKPTLVAFMKWTNESRSKELNVADDHLSLTEKAIKDACDIAEALDASVDNPNIEGWPISKVAVLLIDPKKENCKLQFGSATEGVFSLFEKELDKPRINPENVAEGKVGDKRKRNTLKALTADNELLKIGYDVVQEITDIEIYELKVLGSHVAYSLSKEKSATQFYLIQAPKKFSPNEQAPLKFLAESLQGPLAEKDFGSWSTTEVVSYYHILPYVGFISSWISGKELCLPSIHDGCSQSPISSCSEEHNRSRISASPVSNGNGEDLDHTDCNSSGIKTNSCDETAIENSDVDRKNRKSPSGGEVEISVIKIQDIDIDKNAKYKIHQGRNKQYSAKKNTRMIYLEKIANDMNECENGSLSVPSISLSQNILKSVEPHAIQIYAEKESTKSNLETLKAKNADQTKALKSVPSKGCSPNTLEADNDTQKTSKKVGTVSSARNEEGRDNPNVIDEEREDCHKGSLLGPSITIGLCEISSNSKGTSEKLDSEMRVYYHKKQNKSSAKIDNHDPDDGVKLNVGLVDSLENSFDTECRDGKVSGENGEVAISSDQNRTAKPENQLCQLEAITMPNLVLHNVSSSDKLQNSLALLCSKRQQLFSQICNLEDTLARYEHCIERIRDESDVGLAHQCIGSIISGTGLWMLKHETGMQDEDHNSKSQRANQISLSGIFVPGKSKCQDLEIMCNKNNWRLPRYCVEPSEGKFASNVVVGSKGFKLASKGGLQSSPSEARESAAAMMIDKILESLCETEGIN